MRVVPEELDWGLRRYGLEAEHKRWNRKCGEACGNVIWAGMGWNRSCDYMSRVDYDEWRKRGELPRYRWRPNGQLQI